MPDSDIQIIENCQVEWHKGRGVLYVHNANTGQTIVRLNRLPTCRDYVDLEKGQIDVSAERAAMPYEF